MVVCDQGAVCCVENRGVPDALVNNRAVLIAAAPEILEALEHLTRNLAFIHDETGWGDNTRTALSVSEHIVAKAKEETSGGFAKTKAVHAGMIEALEKAEETLRHLCVVMHCHGLEDSAQCAFDQAREIAVVIAKAKEETT